MFSFLFSSNNCCVDSFGYLSCEQQEQDHEQFEMEQRDDDPNDTDNELEHLAQHVRHDHIHFDMYVRYLISSGVRCCGTIDNVPLPLKLSPA